MNLKKIKEDYSQVILDKLEDHRGWRDDRKDKWIALRNQYRGEYDPEVVIKKGFSRVYPRDTKVRVRNFAARMMDLLFPPSRTNWPIKCSSTPLPSIPADELAFVFSSLELTPDTSIEEIEEAIYSFTQEQADRLTKIIHDQMEEMDFQWWCMATLSSSGIYNFGVVRGPEVQYRDSTYWEVVDDDILITPYDEPVPVFDVVPMTRAYPDFSSPSWEGQRSFFEKVYMDSETIRTDLFTLPGFDEEFVKTHIKAAPDGNATYDDFEELEGISDATGLFEFYRGLLFLFPDFDGIKEKILIEVWIFEDKVVYVGEPPLATKPSEFYHGFVYDDFDAAMGEGECLTEDIRDSQLSKASASRALMDNMGHSAGPIYEVNESYLPKNSLLGDVIRSFQVVRRIGMGQEGNIPAIRSIQSQSHINEILAVISHFNQTLDVESMLPAWLSGQSLGMGGAEALRTSANMSALTSGGLATVRLLLRNFDRFMKSIYMSLIAFNRAFNPYIKLVGDFHVQSDGIIAAMTKEVSGATLDQLFTTLTPEERSMLDTREALRHRLTSKDLPDKLLKSQEVIEQEAAAAQQSSQQALQVEMQKAMAEIERMKAQAEKFQAEVIKTLGQMEPQNERISAQAQQARVSAIKTLRDANSGTPPRRTG